MEKVVTKIGDVTIERRISKPKPALDSSIGNQVQQIGSTFSQDMPKTDDLGRLTELVESNIKPEITITNKTTNRTFSVGGNKEFKFVDLHKKPVSSSASGRDFSCNFSSSAMTSYESSGCSESKQRLENESETEEILEMKESGVSLPKVPRVAPVTASVGINEPDLSKFVGISIERKKKLDIEIQPSRSFGEGDSLEVQDVKPSISIQRISPRSESNEGEDKFCETDQGDGLQRDIISFSDIKRELEEANENQAESVSTTEDHNNEENIKSEQNEALEQDVKENENAHLDKDDQDLPVKEEEEEEEEDRSEDILKGEEEEDSETKDPDINDFACTDLVELMQKGEIEGEIEDVKEEGDEGGEDSEKKKADKRKVEESEEDEEETKDDEEGVKDESGEGKAVKPSKKKKKTEKKEGEDKKETSEGDGDEEGKDKNIDKSKVTNANLRKNIREVMDETKLDEATLSAQRQEAERLKRLQEQQRIIREVQRQIALNRQNQKSQNKVLSLLQGNSQTSILKASSTGTQAQNSQGKNQNSVLVKLSNGEQTSLNNKKMIELLKNSKNKTILSKPPIPKTLFKQGMVTPSVSIAPIIKKEPAIDDKKKKKGDVVTLSSDSEDDCIVLSDEDESEPEEDPTNSGMHTNDKYNLPDEQGRVLVNVGHPESESDLYLAPQIAKVIKPHQIGGIRFLYDNVIESTERFSSSTGFGCILAHSMGLGKTLQIVSFSDIFLRYTSAKTILCIMPINTIQNWLAEFNMWLPKESTSEEVRCRDFELFIVNESLKNINSRAKVILDWKKSGGVLLMGYELFRLLSLKKSHKSKKKKRDAEEEDAKNKELVEEVYSALVVPGPDLVICDEGHRIKNSHATTSQALKQIRTKRRIVLTGYPLQNNLLEYWCMVDFVRPNYLGSKTEFSNMFERPIQNGQCIDSTPQDKRLMRYRAHVLHSLLEGFVQRRSHAVLQSTLPEKEEYVLLLRFTPFQRKLYDTFMNEVVRTVAVPNPLKAFAVCCKIWNHPDVLYNFLKKKGEEIDLDLEEALPPSLQIPQYPYGQQSGSLDAANQQMAPWPRRGPGSRGGKARQANRKGQSIRGRKPAATIPPNVSTRQENMSERYGAGQFPVTNEFSQKNFSNQPETNLENFQGRNYNQNQFGYGNEYDSQGNYGGGNYSKSSLDNLEEMSANNFQGKRYFPRGNEAGNQVHGYGSSSQGFDSSRPETAFSQTSSNDSNINASFESNLNSSDSGYNQTDSTKTFDYSQDFNSDFYSSGNFQNPGTNTNYSRDTKPPVFQQNNPYYQNPDYRNTNNFNSYSSGNSMNPSFQNYDRQNTNFQSAGPNSGYQPSMQRPSPTQRAPGGSQVSNFQNQTLGGSFQDSNPAPNSSFQRNFQTPNSAFDSSANRFPGQSNNSSNFQGNSSNFEINRNKGTGYPGQNSQPATTNFQSSNYEQNYWSQSNNWGYGDSSKGSQEYRSTTAGNSSFMPQQKFNPSFDEGQESAKSETKNFGGGSNNSAMYPKINCDYSSPSFEKSAEGNETKTASVEYEETEGNKAKEDDEKKEEVKSTDVVKKEDTSLPYDWATDLFKNYVTGIIENSSKMEVFVHIVTESIKLGDRLLVFSQSLLTLDLIENYLHRQNVPGKEEIWAKSRNYFRLDGSTPGLEREKLINEFNSNPNIHLFLVSTRAGSLGINLVGANRVVVFDASWNPCHDTQAVCRVYRYGQQKPCYVYRLVMDSCLEKKIYDRQVNKQGMADRVVDELNPDAHLSIKEVTNLCWDDQGDTTVKDFSDQKDKYNDEIIKMLLERCSKVLSKEPFQHESLLIDRKEKKLSQAEKRLAKRSYELEKQAANQPKNIYSFFPNSGQRNFVKPIASVRPMQSDLNARMSPHLQNRSKWIPADVWQKQGMSAQEMTLPLDVVIPTSSPEKTSIVLKAGQKVMVLKSPKGIYMQLENGKIIAIRSAFKVGQNSQGGDKDDIKKEGMSSTVKNVGKMSPNIRQGVAKQPFPKPFTKFPEKKVFHMNTNIVGKGKHVMVAKAKPFVLNRKMENAATDVKHKMINSKVGFNDQDDKSDSDEATIVEEKVVNVPERRDSSVEEGSFTDEAVLSSSDEKTEEKSEEGKCGVTDSLETLRKVTEKISDPIKRDTEPEPEIQYQQNSALKNYRQNFTSQVTETPTAAIEEKQAEMTNVGVSGGAVSQQSQTQVPVVGAVPTNRINSGMGGSLNRGTGVVGTGNNMNIGSSITGNNMGTTTQITNNRTNATTGTGSTISVSGVSSGSISDSGKDEKRDSTTATGQNQQQGNDNIQNWLMNQSYPPVDPYGNYFPGYYAYGPGPAPMMPPYEGFYPPNNYPMGRNSSTVPPTNPKPQLPDTQKTTSQPTQPIANPIAQNVQTATTPRNPPVVNTPPMYPPYPNPYPYHYNYPSNPNFNSQGFSFPNQSQPSQQTTTATTQNTPNPTISSTQQNQASTYDNSMYSAFHRPEAPFQTPDPNPYPSPYPRPPYPSSGTPGFFPYNPPYPNYPYSHNFNPYMHPTGYGYPMQNHPSGGQGSHSNVGVGSSGSGNGGTTNTS